MIESRRGALSPASRVIALILIASGGLLVVLSCSILIGEHYFPKQLHRTIGWLLPHTLSSLQIDPEEVNCGTMVEGEEKTYRLTYQNNSDQALRIVDYRACSCIRTQLPGHPIQPGQKGALEIVFDSSNRPGIQEVRVAFDTDRSGEPPAFVLFTATIRKPVEITPAALSIPAALPGETLTATLQIQSDPDVRNLSCTAPFDRAQVELVAAGDQEYELQFRLAMPNAIGSQSGRITLRCECDAGSWEGKIPVVVTVPEPFLAIPKEVTLRNGRGMLSLKTVWPELFQVTGFESSTAALTLREKWRKPGYLALALAFEPNTEKLPENTRVIVTTSCPEMPRIEIAVSTQD
jgi:hypothetical protein